MERKKIHRGRIAVNVGLQVLAVGILLALANWYAFNNYFRQDVSRDDKQRLSEQTRGMLRRLKDEVSFIVLMQQNNILLPDVINLLREYQFTSKRKVSVELVPPATSYERALELKKQFDFELNEDVVIIQAAGRHKIIPAQRLADFDTSGMERGLRPRITSFLGERVFTSAMLELLEQEPAIVYLIYGHGEPEAEPGGELTRLGALITRQNITLRGLPLSQLRVIPDDADAVILPGPQIDLMDAEIGALTAYWARGGRLFIFLWNGAETPRLHAFLAGRGVFARQDQVVAVAQQGVAVSKIRDVAAVASSDHPVTRRYKELPVLLRGRTGSLALGDPAPVGLRSIPLLTTRKSSGYWGESDLLSIETDRLPVFDPTVDAGGDLIVAASVEQQGPTDERIKSASGRLIVVGNAFCLHNVGLTSNVADFVSSGLNWLLDRNELVGITPKALNEFPPNLTDEQLATIMRLVVLGMPSLAAVLGFAVWAARRR